MKTYLKKNSTTFIILIILIALFILAATGMSAKDFVITSLRGFSTGSVTFLVAAGFSLIFGLLDVLNLAQGTLYMIGAYIGWTVYVRTDTFIDLVPPIFLILSGFALNKLWTFLANRLKIKANLQKIIAWLLIIVGGIGIIMIFMRFPVAFWDLDNYALSPITYSFMADQGAPLLPIEAIFEDISPLIAIFGFIISSSLVAFGLALNKRQENVYIKINWRDFLIFASLVIAASLVSMFNTPLTATLTALSTNWLFVIAVLVAVISGIGLGVLLESTLIRPLYNRPIYQLMLTIGIGTIGIEVVQAIWGRPEFVFPRPEFFKGTGEGCPATSLAGLFTNNCSTVMLLGGRVRVYDEIFIPLVGVFILIAVWILLKKTRIGMIIRAGVQDRQMVEALGINVRRVFTLVFSLGVGLAAFGGVLSAPSIGLSTGMGERLLLSALIALAVGGLTSYPGAALGSLLVGLIQQFLIKYGQIGIPIPFTDIIFKPSPPIIPASTVLLMIVILLILPGGLLGKKEQS
jgi:branched-chain amino acid transport system permease protein